MMSRGMSIMKRKAAEVLKNALELPPEARAVRPPRFLAKMPGCTFRGSRILVCGTGQEQPTTRSETT